MALGLVGAWLLAEVLAPTGAGPSPTAFLAGSLWFGFFGAAAAGSFFLHLASRRPLREKLVATLLGALGAVALALAGRDLRVVAGVGLGAGSLAVLAVAAWRAKGAARGAALDVLLPGLLLPGFVIVSRFYLALTATLWPTTWDAFTFAADGAFGLQISFLAGRLFLLAPALGQVAFFVYVALPLAFVAVDAAAARDAWRRAPDPIVAFLAVALGGYALYFLFPVIGPIYLFPDFPLKLPAAPPLAGALGSAAAARNCMPSLHASWALTAFWLARPYGRGVRALTGAFLVFTLLATLGTGYHYFVDLVAAVPFTAAMLATVSPEGGDGDRARRRLLLSGVALLAGWLALVRFAPTALSAPLMWGIALAVVALPALGVAALHRSLAAPLPVVAVPAAPALANPDARRLEAWIGLILFGSGFVALCYEVVLARAFAAMFGGSARAALGVLSVYMGGLALGLWLGGRSASRSVRPLRAFAWLTLGVGVWCALFPVALRAARLAYRALAEGADPSAAWLVPVQMAAAASALLPATVLLGCSLPFLVRFFAERGESAASAVGRLCWTGIAGAAAGTILLGYGLLPLVGLGQTMLFAVLLNGLVALGALGLARRVERETPGATTPPAAAAGPTEPRESLRLGWIALAIACVSGIVSFALEMVHRHVLAAVAGNSTYACSLTVFAVLIGLSAGGAAGQRLLATAGDPPALLSWLLAGEAAVVLLSVRLWEAIPDHFAGYQGYPLATTFGAREVVRFVVSSAVLIPPSLFIGASYPVLIAWVEAASPGRVIAAVGRAGALNLTGNIAGAVLGAFVLVPLLGSLAAEQVVAAGALALSALALAAAERRRGPAVGLAAAAALFAVQPRGLDYTRLASGANVYFAARSYGRVVDHAESQDGGLTTVAESEDSGGARVATMQANGVFQGADRRDREMAAQVSLTLIPLLHTPARGAALVIGLRTGVPARVASDAGFAELHVAELARDVVNLADRDFRTANGSVLSRSGTTVHVAGGRDLLALSRRRYDFVGTDGPEIWVAGAAAFYNREFYEMARSRLTEHGVLQQRVPLHDVSRADVLSIVATARSVFPSVWLYLAPNHGVLVACAWDCRVSEAAVARLAAARPLAADLAFVGGVARLLDERLLGPSEVNRLIESSREWGLGPEDLVSTDDNLLLEYSTPRANVRPYDLSLQDNLAFVGRLRPASATDETALSEPAMNALRARAAPGAEKPPDPGHN